MSSGRLFERYVAIDWSGAALDSKRLSGLAVADGDGLVRPHNPGAKHWNRKEIVAELVSRLSPGAPRTLVAVDAAFSYPYGFHTAVFGVPTWQALVHALAAEGQHPAREVARRINHRTEGGGPFRDNRSRNDGSFYSRYNVAYFRAVELLMPQSISPFYLGSGPAVGFHTLTFMRALNTLLDARDRGAIDFQVWPQEAWGPQLTTHVVAECYPALYGSRVDFDGTPDEQDALRTVDWLQRSDAAGELAEALGPVRKRPFGRRTDASWEEQIRFEGWVLGV